MTLVSASNHFGLQAPKYTPLKGGCIKEVGDVRMGALKETPGLSKGRKRSWTQESPGNASPLGSIEIFNLKH